MRSPLVPPSSRVRNQTTSAQRVAGIRVRAYDEKPFAPKETAGVPEFFVSILPGWEEPRKRLGKLAVEAKEVESGLFLFRK